MKKHAVVLLFVPLLPVHAIEVIVPQVEHVNENKGDFIAALSTLSTSFFTERRSAIAPFGGVKITPFAELSLHELIIVTNSFPGTPQEIRREFVQGREKLTQVLRQSLKNGSMSTSDVLSVTAGAQLLARLKLELGVKKVRMSYWATTNSGASQEAFSDREMSSSDLPLATVFEFELNGKKARLVFISSFIQSDSSPTPGLPSILNSFVPKEGSQWIYLSADGLGHFSANRNNGLTTANQQLLNLLQGEGAVLLDYPTDPAYSRPQVFGGISFMQGRLDLEEMGLIRELTVPVNEPGIFGYCLHPGDEVRVYRKDAPPALKRGPELKQIEKDFDWELK